MGVKIRCPFFGNDCFCGKFGPKINGFWSWGLLAFWPGILLCFFEIAPVLVLAKDAYFGDILAVKPQVKDREKAKFI